MRFGIFGAIFIGLSIITIPKLGGAAYIALLVTGQMIAALAVDNYGWPARGVASAQPLPGTRCMRCGKAGGVALIKRGGAVDPWHEDCLAEYVAAMANSSFELPDLGLSMTK